MDWRPQVEKHIANIGIPLDVFAVLPFQWFFAFWNIFSSGCWNFVNHPTVHSGGVRRGRVCVCWYYWEVIGDRLHYYFIFLLLSFLSDSVRFGICAHVNRFSVSRVRDFLNLFISYFNCVLYFYGDVSCAIFLYPDLANKYMNCGDRKTALNRKRHWLDIVIQKQYLVI